MLATGRTEGFQVANFNRQYSLCFLCTFFVVAEATQVSGDQGGMVIQAMAGEYEGMPALSLHPESEMPFEPFRRILPGVVIVPPGGADSLYGIIDPVEELLSRKNRSIRPGEAQHGQGEYAEEARYAKNHPGKRMLEGEDDSYALRAPVSRSGPGAGGLPGGGAKFRQVPGNQNGDGGSGSTRSGKAEPVEKKTMDKDSQPSGQQQQPVQSLREKALAALGLDKELPQATLQERLTVIQQEQGLLAALRTLYEYLTWLGYLPGNWEKGLEHFEYPDPDTGITFRAMINHPRSEYSENYDKKSTTWAEGAQCWICPENIGDARHPVNRFLRVFQLRLNGREYFLQPPPFPYGTLHFVLAEKHHIKMHVDQSNLQDALTFLELLPEFTVCMNSDIENAGGSIIGHHHFQVFHDYWPPVTEAEPVSGLQLVAGGLEVDILGYPFTVVRISSADGENLVAGAAKLIEYWKQEDRARHTANYVFRKTGDQYRMWLFLRRSDLQPVAEFQHFKPEPVGFIEIAGDLLLSRQKTPEATQSLKEVEIMLPVIKKGLSSISPVGSYEHDELLRLISHVVEESTE